MSPIKVSDSSPGLRRRRPTALTAYCLVGIAVAGGITVYEAAHPPLVSIGKLTKVRSGADTVVRAPVTTSSKQAQCPIIHVVASDTNAKTLAEVVAQPIPLSAPLVAGHAVVYQATVKLSPDDYRQKLKGFAIYLYQEQNCPSTGSNVTG